MAQFFVIAQSCSSKILKKLNTCTSLVEASLLITFDFDTKLDEIVIESTKKWTGVHGLTIKDVQDWGGFESGIMDPESVKGLDP